MRAPAAPLALALLLAGAAAPGMALAQMSSEAGFSLWDIKLGQPVTDIPDTAAAVIACGTGGGPASIELKSFGDWATCEPEASGLREVTFTYDDEKDYIARAMELEFRALAPGTSAYAHPVIISVLVDDKGLAQGIRMVTDDRASNHDRRLAVALRINLKARFDAWGLACADVPMADGEMKIGNEFIHDRCTGMNPDGSGQQVLIEAEYLRRKGQVSVSQETQSVNKDAYTSSTWLELVAAPYSPSEAP
jgi:hypothetical protein